MSAKANNTVFDTVYNTIKNKILHLEYRPGKVVSVASLAENLKVSRTPVHDALMKLATENLIDVFPKCGSRVSLIDIKKTEDERFLRKALELSALKEMFYNYDDSYLKIMEECILKQEKSFNENRLIDTLYWDMEYHAQIFKCIGREYCYHISKKYSANDYRIRLLAEKAITTTPEAVLQNHRDIVRFIRDRNLEATLQIEEQHLSRISSEITALVAAFPDIFTKPGSSEIPAKIRKKENYNENFLNTIKPIRLK